MKMNNEPLENQDALAELRLIELCEDNAHERYGEAIPPEVAERLECELDAIFKKMDFCYSFLTAFELAKECKERNAPTILCGRAGTSLVAFLLGITQTNPLAAHLYCPRCGYTDFDYKKHFNKPGEITVTDCGFDLVNPYQHRILCPECHEEFIGDGHDLPFEVFLNQPGKMPVFKFLVPEELKEDLDALKTEILNDFFGDDIDGQQSPDVTAAVIHGDPMLSMMKELQELTEVSEAAIPIDGIDLCEFFRLKKHTDIPVLKDMPQEIIESVLIAEFSGIVDILGYYRGSEVMDEKLLTELYPLEGEKIIAHCEDVFQTLTKHGVDKETALRIMTQVRYGNAGTLLDEDIAEMKARGIPDVYIDSMKGIVSLEWRSDSTEYAVKLFKLMWYKQNFPKEYYAALR